MRGYSNNKPWAAHTCPTLMGRRGGRKRILLSRHYMLQEAGRAPRPKRTSLRSSSSRRRLRKMTLSWRTPTSLNRYLGSPTMARGAAASNHKKTQKCPYTIARSLILNTLMRRRTVKYPKTRRFTKIRASSTCSWVS